MKFYTANRETGMFIEEVNSVEEGKELINKYEKTDKEEGTYEDNFYDVVNEEHISVL